ncbi:MULTISPECIES: DUF3383 family protein [Fusobacterium]|jgi:hypothetical protein|uniref:DUF3383 family protein n=1 Tax=Fusobacterium TaxID=848 RepID=UPI000E83CBC9|nr:MULTISPECIES: DUF3383 family protein [Fusobacterium]DAE77821.1 MAG TPA: Protein of unknown function (DUF3383) [Caudoviricetes sp.]HBJ79732.1 hypothetical protein [Fusobacterium sp.]
MLFFGNEDVRVLIEKTPKYTLGKLDKILIATIEEDIPAMALSGSNGKAELKKWLEDNTKEAPLLLKAVEIALGQEDNSGNKLTTEYLFVIGAKNVENEMKIMEAIEEFDKTKEADFYAVLPLFENEKFETWAQTYTPNHMYGIYTTTKRSLADTSKSGRIVGQSYTMKGTDKNTNEFNTVAWFARMLFSNIYGGWKFKKLNGITTDTLTGGEVTQLAKEGWNGYRNVRGKGQTTGSICTDASTHADETLLRDTVIYNVANVLMDMFDNEEIVPMGYDGKKLIRAYLDKALIYCGTLGLIERGEDGGYLYEINIPEITAIMKSMREITGITFTYSPNIPLEKITVTGKEVLEWTGGNE